MIVSEPTSRTDRTNLGKRTKERSTSQRASLKEHLTSQKDSFQINQTLKKSKVSKYFEMFLNDVNILFYIIHLAVQLFRKSPR